MDMRVIKDKKEDLDIVCIIRLAVKRQKSFVEILSPAARLHDLTLDGIILVYIYSYSWYSNQNKGRFTNKLNTNTCTIISLSINYCVQR